MKKILVLTITALLLSLASFATDFDGYVVKISDNTAELLGQSVSMFSEAELFADMEDSDVVQAIATEFEDISEINSNHMLVKVDNQQALDDLISLGIVESYEENFYLELHGYDVTLNTDYASQKWYLDYINADFAWNAGVFGSDTKVAVIDSGVYPHKDIKNNLIPGKNYVDGMDETDTVDNYNHGTHVAGIIASQCNSLATVGVAFKSKIVPLKVTDSKSLTISYAVKAIYDAVDVYDCDVINMSFGDTNMSTSLENAVKYAINNNVIVVASAGNGGDSGYAYPAAFDDVVSVANAYESNGSLAIYSSSQKNDMVDIAAPGTYITAISNDGGVTSQIRGTSFSAPIISAVAALAKSINPNITPSEFQTLLKQSADSSYIKTSGQNSNAWGAGLVDVEAFIKLMLADKKCYVSKNVTINDEALVYITNLSDTDLIEDCTVIFNEYDEHGYLTKTKNVTISVPASQSYELSLTKNGFSSSAVVRAVCDHLPGDINSDGKVSILDASELLRYIAGYPVNSIESALDVNGDGKISILDVSSILRYCAGYPVELY